MTYEELYIFGESLRTKEFNEILDTYLLEKKMDSTSYEDLTEEQRIIIQCLKRSFKRIKSKYGTRI